MIFFEEKLFEFKKMEGIRKCPQILVSSGLVFTVTFFVYGSAKACGVLFKEMEDMNGMGGLTNGLIFSLPAAMNQLAGKNSVERSYSCNISFNLLIE